MAQLSRDLLTLRWVEMQDTRSRGVCLAERRFMMLVGYRNARGLVVSRLCLLQSVERGHPVPCRCQRLLQCNGVPKSTALF